MEALGAVDELVAALGAARADAGDADLAAALAGVQTELYLLMADLAAPMEDAPPRLGDDAAARLERMIDETDARLPPLTDFVIPGAGRLSAQLHVARTICRRAERRIVALGRSSHVAEGTLAYVNRLSDLLFVLARWADHAAGHPEATFKGELKA
jgi:cob(I)alamin adenosyltransferase